MDSSSFSKSIVTKKHHHIKSNIFYEVVFIAAPKITFSNSDL